MISDYQINNKYNLKLSSLNSLCTVHVWVYCYLANKRNPDVSCLLTDDRRKYINGERDDR